MTRMLFVTATDTDAGKTLVSAAIISLLSKGNKVAAFKPVSAGCEEVEGQLINEDAKLLQSQANCAQTIENVNPIAYKEPIAPHIAAQTLNQSITINSISQHYDSLLSLDADFILTEGAGGWRLPLGNGKYLSDFAVKTNQDVILVVNMKLGCLNHALLTFEAIKQDGLNCAGWVANCFEKMSYLDENIAELKSLLSVPCLGIIPKVDNHIQASEYLDLSPLY